MTAGKWRILCGVTALLVGFGFVALWVFRLVGFIGPLALIQSHPVPGSFDVELEADRPYAVVVEQEADDPRELSIELPVTSVEVTDPTGQVVPLDLDPLEEEFLPWATVATFEPTQEGRYEVVIVTEEPGIARVTFAEPFTVLTDFFDTFRPFLLAIAFLVLGAGVLLVDLILRMRRPATPAVAPVATSPLAGRPSVPPPPPPPPTPPPPPPPS